ncbi:MAG: hypothetical protein AAF282_15595 [Cyanobacteria bacterium P01_A01_bin.15]
MRTGPKGGYDPVPPIPMVGETDLSALVLSKKSSATAMDAKYNDD